MHHPPWALVVLLAAFLTAAALGAAPPAAAAEGRPQGCSGGDEGALTWLGLPSDHAALQALEKSLWFCDNGGFGFDLATLYWCLRFALGLEGPGACP